MRIALDFDGTYTEDAEMWRAFVHLAKRRGHEVVCVTMRHDNDDERIEMPCEVIYTERKAKLPFLEERSIKIDVWIDDSPHWIFQNG